MNLGKPVKVVVIPDREPVRRPVQTPRREAPEPLIPLPADWPRRKPALVPQPTGQVSQC